MLAVDILQGVSVIVAALVALYGVTAWRREYVGKKQLELAEEVLALFYEARDAVAFIRSPVGYVGEGSSRQAAPNETPEEKSINDNAYVVFERYGKRQELFNKLHAMRYRYLARFGKDSAKPFNDLDAIVREILASGRTLALYWKEQGVRQWTSQEEFRRHLDAMTKQEAVFWDMGPDKDKITPRIDAAVAGIEAQASKVIGKFK